MALLFKNNLDGSPKQSMRKKKEEAAMGEVDYECISMRAGPLE